MLANALKPDLDEAGRFLAAMTGDAPITFQTFTDAKDKPRPDPRARVYHGTLGEVGKILTTLNTMSAGVFWQVNEGDLRGRSEENVQRVRALFLDLDGSPLPDPMPITPHAIVESSPGRFHVYWRADGVALGEFSALQRALAEKYGGDVSVNDAPRVLRVPGFWHVKGEPYQSHLVMLRDAPPYPRDELVEKLGLTVTPGSKERRAGGSPGEAPKVPAWDRATALKLVLGRRLRTGDGRRDLLKSYVASRSGRGLYEQELRALVTRFAEAHFDPADPIDEGDIAELIRYFAAKDERRTGSPTNDGWPKPGNPLKAFSAAPFSSDDAPPVIAQFAKTFARAAGMDESAAIVACTVAAAAAIDDRIRLQVNPASGWFESARLWGLLVGGPAAGKTPVLKAAGSPIVELHGELFRDWLAANGGKPEEEQERRPALYTSDATTEALADILRDNPRGLLYMTEEFESWLGSHDAYRNAGASRDRGEWLRLYDGGPHQVNRVKRGSFYVPNWSASILTATTPAALRKLAGRLPTDGLLQRFIVCTVAPRGERDGTLLQMQAKEAREAYAGRIRQLCSEIVSGNVTVNLTRAAREAFEQEERALLKLTAGLEAQSPALAAHVGKHAAMLLRVALAFQMVTAHEDVSEETMRCAIGFMRRAFAHATAVYSSLFSTEGGHGVAQALARSILAKGLAEVNVLEMRQACRQYRGAHEDVRKAAVEALETFGWLRALDDRQRSSWAHGCRWAVNPRVHELFIAEAAEARAMQAEIRARLAGEREADESDCVQ